MPIPTFSPRAGKDRPLGSRSFARGGHYEIDDIDWVTFIAMELPESTESRMSEDASSGDIAGPWSPCFHPRPSTRCNTRTSNPVIR